MIFANFSDMIDSHIAGDEESRSPFMNDDSVDKKQSLVYE
jgi:hypothetical protein